MSKEIDLRKVASVYRASRHPQRTESLVVRKETLEQTEVSLVHKILEDKLVRRVASLFLDKSPNLSVTERLGSLYLTAFSLYADTTVDEGRIPAGAASFEDNLFSYEVPNLGVTIGDLKAKTLACFATNSVKQEALNRFFQTYIPILAAEQGAEAGQYTTSRVHSYREQTNTVGTETFAILTDKPDQTADYIQGVKLIQLNDDVGDWPLDIKEKSLNLFVAHATEIAERETDPHPEELQRLIAYAALPEHERPKMSLRTWTMQNTPRTRLAYLEEFEDAQLKKSVSRPLLWWVKRRI